MHPPFVSVILATRDRPASLSDALDALLGLEYPNYEVVVVDNAPTTSGTRKLIEERYASSRVRYVREDHPGLSWARNRGIVEARGEILAFTDDDIVADLHWLTALVEGFRAADNVGCVTGPVLPYEIETPAQQWFEQYGVFGIGLKPQIVDLGKHRPPNPGFPYVGTAPIMAFRASALRAVQGFDPALGAGTLTRGGEDLKAKFDVITRGFSVVYQPSALEFHRHRADYLALHRQMYGYGTGFTAYLTSIILRRPSILLDFARKGVRFVTGFVQSKRTETMSEGGYYPAELRNLELRGMVMGPLLYLRSWFRAQQLIRQHGELVIRPPVRVAEPTLPDFEPTRILAVELTEPIPSISPIHSPQTGRLYQQALVVVRLHSHPIGPVRVSLPDSGVGADRLAHAIWEALGPAIVEHLQHDQLPATSHLPVSGLPPSATPACLAARRDVLQDPPFVSVIVATRDRPESLSNTLNSLLALDYPRREVIVVDNAPSTDVTFRLIEERYASARVRYVREDRPGLSWARNRGIHEARGEILAFTDDDIVVDRHWLTALVEGLRVTDRVGCVTGLVVPYELESPAQHWFEQYGGLGLGWQARIADLGEHRPPNPGFPYVGAIAGASMAFPASVLRAIHGFDPALGAGTPTRGGEDLKAKLDVVMQGLRVVYQPSALAHHRHRTDYPALHRQMYGYGTGLTAYLTSAVLHRPQILLDFARKSRRYATGFIRSKRMETVSQEGFYPPELRNLELRGMAMGPLLYLRSRLQVQRLIRRHGSLEIRPSAPAAQPSFLAFQPTRVVEVELTEPIPDIPVVESPYTGRPYRRALIVVRLHTHPLGVLPLPLPARGMTSAALAEAIWDAFDVAVTQHLKRDGIPPISDIPVSGIPPVAEPACLAARRRILQNPPFVSVVVCTRDRTDSLAAALDALLALDYPKYELIVVDNAPGTEDTFRLIQDRYSFPPVRYVREDRPGLAWARNRGILEARGEIVAFTDDDAVADRHWLSALVEGLYAADNVGCVTGLGLPWELETPAQQLFEQYGGFIKGFERRIVDLGDHRPPIPSFPYSVGAFGAGSNMAFRVSALRSIHGFDPVLGAGTPTRGGEDFRAFLDIVTSGRQLVYQPSALIRHRHRSDYPSLRRQLVANGISLVSYMISSFRHNPRLTVDFVRKAGHSFRYLQGKKSMSTLARDAAFPQELRNAELRGMALGPLAYVRSIWNHRQIVRRWGLLPLGPAAGREDAPELTFGSVEDDRAIG